VGQIRAERATARLHERRAQQLIDRVLTLPSGGSGRDLGVLIGLSHQRVHQLLLRSAGAARASGGRATGRASTVEGEA
jgi:hypothetical protein